MTRTWSLWKQAGSRRYRREDLAISQLLQVVTRGGVPISVAETGTTHFDQGIPYFDGVTGAFQVANGTTFADFASSITLPIANDWRIEFDYLYEFSNAAGNSACRPISAISNTTRLQFRDPGTSDGDDLRLMASGNDYEVWPLAMQKMNLLQWNHLVFTHIAGVFALDINGNDQGVSVSQGLGFNSNYLIDRIYSGGNQPMGEGAGMNNLEIEDITAGALWEYALDEGTGLISTNANVGTGPNDLTWTEENWLETIESVLSVDLVGAIDHYHQGLPFTAANAIAASVAAVASYGSGGMPLDAAGRLATEKVAVDYFSAGIPYTAAGALSTV